MGQRLRFTKMHGLGNDFVVIDAVRQHVQLQPRQIQAISDRHFGVGCDQLLLVEPPTSEGAAFRYRIFNADGHEVGQCGNGARCFAAFVRAQGLTDATEIAVETASGPLVLSLEPDERIRVRMGAPRFGAAQIPVALGAPGLTFAAGEPGNTVALDLGGETVRGTALSLGNPHFVLGVDDLDRTPIVELAARIQAHPGFPEGVNVGFAQVIAPTRVRLRVVERGVGETWACGSGACAAVAAGQSWGVLDPRVEVALRAGLLEIFRETGGDLMMIGPVASVFEGEVDIEALDQAYPVSATMAPRRA